ncbi:hypothetical protein QEJ31_07100 [Pigmentibacter sp. JX0631]|uniref:hypothetical protein n=1 Tax=Pigmentibacter sp. JX0631 TaxID=2976982 RepID=UPI0024690C88|nr:hypothetical protein [Pigmentibacter sp. JX0631]WGL61359.1 hypothetical protein QEJ31_07100 [Pigmentibacter sp. JX0631]
MNNQDKEKHDIIDAEFVNLSEEVSNKSNNNHENRQFNSDVEKYNFNINNDERFKTQNQNNFNSFFYSFQKNDKMKLQKFSFFKLILLLPFILITFCFFVLFGLIAFVIFLPKIYKFFRRKGISGLKMDYNFLRGLFSHFRVK